MPAGRQPPVERAHAVVRRGFRLGRRVRRRVERRLAANVAVLCYHRVGPAACDPWDLAVTPVHFDQQIAALSTLGRVVPLHDALNSQRRIGRSNRRFAITFDDGYADNLFAALPVLERHRAPATVFIPTGYLDRPSFWWERIAELTLASSRSVGEIVASCVRTGVLPAGMAPADRTELHAAVYDHLAPRGRVAIDDRLDQLCDDLEVDRITRGSRPLTRDELIQLAQHPLISIGDHTADHRKLTALAPEAAIAQVVQGREDLDRIVGPARRPFAYPHGDADRRTARLVAAAGFEVAVTTDPRWVSPLDRAHLIPRLHPKDVDGATFAAWISAG